MPGSCRLTRSRMRSTGPILVCAGKRWRSCSAGIDALTASTKPALRTSSRSDTTAVRTPCLRSTSSICTTFASSTADNMRRSSSSTGVKQPRRSSCRYGGKLGGRRALFARVARSPASRRQSRCSSRGCAFGVAACCANTGSLRFSVCSIRKSASSEMPWLNCPMRAASACARCCTSPCNRSALADNWRDASIVACGAM